MLLQKMRRAICVSALVGLLFPNFALAWNDKTHIAIAYLAYKRLGHHAKERVDEILVLHPKYFEWTKGVKPQQKGFIAFLHAATWPDEIQDPSKYPGYVEDGTDHGLIPAIGQEEWQNIGFSDKLMHKYWHFIQRPFAAEGIAIVDPPRPNIETQLQMLMEALNSNEEDALKSYDLAWIENLIGDLHQPLNCITRFSEQHPKGDMNGRDVKLQPSELGDNLHAYWDNLLGTERDMESAMKEGKALSDYTNPYGFFDQIDVDKWVSEDFDIAKKSAYTEAVIAGDSSGNAFALDADYRDKATKIALRQAALAGNRLVSVLDNYLK